MKGSRIRSLVLAALVGATALGMAESSEALPRVGMAKPAARAVDAEGRPIDVGAILGRPILVVYEDKESATLNAQLKSDLSALARGDRYRNAVALVPVANVEAYDYWPVRGFVKDAIKDESRKIGATIFCDWDGGFRRSFGLAGNTSSVVLVGREGRVLFAWEGAVPKVERERLLSLLRAEVER